MKVTIFYVTEPSGETVMKARKITDVNQPKLLEYRINIAVDCTEDTNQLDSYDNTSAKVQ